MTELWQIAAVFLRLGLLAFGGSTSVLAELDRVVVAERGWLSEREFVDCFALGQLTPGPGLLMVMFVGYRVAGVPGALTALAAISLPSALMSAAVAAHWEAIRRSPWPAALQRGFAPIALGLTAAGVYTILRAAITDLPSLAVAVAAGWLLWRGRWHPALVILLGGAGSIALALAGGWRWEG